MSAKDIDWDDISRRNKEIPRLKAELAILKEKFLLTYCAYCGEKFKADQPDKTDDISAHIKACVKHPMRGIERERDVFREALSNLFSLARRKRMRAPDYEWVDNACRECPGATTVKDWFLCAFHNAEKALTGRGEGQ